MWGINYTHMMEHHRNGRNNVVKILFNDKKISKIHGYVKGRVGCKTVYVVRLYLMYFVRGYLYLYTLKNWKDTHENIYSGCLSVERLWVLFTFSFYFICAF